MSELVGRFLSFEDHLGRGLVKFVYYVLLFLLVVTTIFDLVVALIAMFTEAFWPALWTFLVVVPLSFLVKLLLLRVGAELVMAILSIDDHLRPEGASDTMSTGLNPVTPPTAAPTMTAPVMAASSGTVPENDADSAGTDTAPAPARKTPARKKAAKKSSRKATKKTAAKKTARAAAETDGGSNASAPPKEPDGEPKDEGN